MLRVATDIANENSVLEVVSQTLSSSLHCGDNSGIVVCVPLHPPEQRKYIPTLSHYNYVCKLVCTVYVRASTASSKEMLTLASCSCDREAEERLIFTAYRRLVRLLWKRNKLRARAKSAPPTTVCKIAESTFSALTFDTGA